MNCKNCRQNCAWAGKERSEHGKCFVGYIPTTNADRIRSMTDEELAEWFCTMCSFGDFCPYKDDCDTNGSGVLKWLKEEVKE